MGDPESVPFLPPERPEARPQGDPARPQLSPSASLELLERIRQGDRQAAAEFVARSAPLIRRRFRGKIARSLRTLFDSDDLLATISRRLDDLVRRRELTATSEAQLWALLARLATNSVSEHARHDLRGNPDPGASRPTPLSAGSHEMKPDAAVLEPLLEQCLAELSSEIDQRTLRMRLEQRTHAQIAASEGVSVETARKRWQRVRSTVRAVLGLVGIKDPGQRRASSRIEAPTHPGVQPPAIASHTNEVIETQDPQDPRAGPP